MGYQDNHKNLLDMDELGRANLMVDALAKKFCKEITKVGINWVGKRYQIWRIVN